MGTVYNIGPTLSSGGAYGFGMFPAQDVVVRSKVLARQELAW